MDAWIKSRHMRYTVYLAASKKDDSLVVDYYKTEGNPKKVIYLGQGVYKKDGSFTSQTPCAKKPGKASLLTNNIGYQTRIRFVGETKRVATRYLNGDPVKKIKDIEQAYRQAQTKKRAEARKNKNQKDMDLFEEPIYPVNKIRLFAETKITPYIYRYGDQATCTSCGGKLAEKRIRGSATCPKCGVTASITRQDCWESIPVLVADVRNGHAVGAYYVLTTYFDKFGVRQEHFSEVARYVDHTPYVMDENEWHQRKMPYFSESVMGRENSRCVASCYVIPTQFAHYLHKVNPQINERSLNHSAFIKNAEVYGLETLPYNTYYRTEEIRNYIYEFAHDSNRVALYNFLMANGGSELAAYVMFDSKIPAGGDPLQALGLTAEQWSIFKKTKMDKAAFDAVKDGSQMVDLRLFDGFQELNRRYHVNGVYAVPQEHATGLLVRYINVQNGTQTEFHRTYFVNGEKTEMYPGKAGKWFTTKESVRGTPVMRKEDIWRLSCMQYMPRDIGITKERLGILSLWIKESGTDNLQIYERVYKGGFVRLANSYLEQAKPNKIGYSFYTNTRVRLLNKPLLHECLGVTKEFLKHMPRDLGIEELLSMQGYCRYSEKPRWHEYAEQNAVLEALYGHAMRMEDWQYMWRNHKPLEQTVEWLKTRKEAGEYIRLTEYATMLDNLEAAKTPLTKEHIFPKVFLDEQKKAHDAAEGCKNAWYSEQIQKISEALYKDKDVRKFMKAGTKYMVFVPENAFELVNEGERLHNCLRTYVPKVAAGKSCIFFIREADKPDAAFYAMEINPETGEIVQLHGQNNKNEENPEREDSVTTFARSWANVLKKIKFNPRKVLEHGAA